jgi:hypothetical protein
MGYSRQLLQHHEELGLWGLVLGELGEVQHHPLVGVGAAVVAGESLHPLSAVSGQPIRQQRSVGGPHFR